MVRKGTHFVPIEDAPTGRLSDRAREILALGLCGASLYALLCLATFRKAELDGPIPFGGGHNLGGTFGYYLGGGFTHVLGLAGWVPFLALLGYAITLFLHRRVDRLLIKVIGAVVFAALVAVLLAGPDGRSGYAALTPQGAGGAFGGNLSPRLHEVFGGPGRILLVGFGALVSLLLVTEWMFSTVLTRAVAGGERLWRRLRGLPPLALEIALMPAGGGIEAGSAGDRPPVPRRRAGAAAKNEDDDDEAAASAAAPGRPAPRWTDEDEDAEADDDEPRGAAPARKRPVGRSDDDDDADDEGADEPPYVLPTPKVMWPQPPPSPPVAPAAPAASAPAPAPVKPKPRPKPKRVAQSELPFDEAYPFPPIDLFRETIQTDLGATQGQLQRGGDSIVQKLGSFGIQAEVVGASVGPAVTQFELRLAEGIRVNKIAGFEADLAAALKAVAVRVVAPIPGKDTIGVEVPNGERQKVPLRDLLEQFGRAHDLAIPLFLGKDVAGNAIVEDLARMPHLLIAGTTGSGKSVCINSILLSILMTRTPAQVKLILVDPKMVELQAFKRVPHLCCDVVTNMKKAPSVLQWAVDEMENRYALLSGAGVNHIRSYNRLGQQELQKRTKKDVEPDRVHLPYIVIVIDEFADLMNVAQNEVEESIQRLAQKSRAVGMHVILATQRPSSEVITGIIKANLPCQIAFKVNRRIDSRVILDANGAEKLLGYGDMLYVPPGGGVMMRAQGAFVAEDEMQAVVRFLEEQGQQPSFLPALMQTQGSSRQGMAERDALYREAVEVILGQQRGSATLLQRALSVGYTRATRLLEMMEEDGLVGAFVGSKSREVLLSLDEWKAREAAMAAELEAIDSADAAAGTDAADGDTTESDTAEGDGAVVGGGEVAPPLPPDGDGEAREGTREG